jgi:hypothetical protein
MEQKLSEAQAQQDAKQFKEQRGDGIIGNIRDRLPRHSITP